MVNMRSKRTLSIALMVIGAVLILYSLQAMNRISAAKSEVHTISGLFSGSPEGQAAGGFLGQQASQYDTSVRLLLVGGIVIAGCGAVLFFRKR